VKAWHREREPVGHDLARDTTIVDVFRDNARLLADRPALRHWVDGAWAAVTWGEYDETVRRVTAGLAELGVERGDRVGVLSANRVEWHEADLGILTGAGVTVPVYATSASSQVAYMLGHADAKVVFVENAQQLSKVLLRRHELPDLEHIVLFDTEDGLDGDVVLSWTELLVLGDQRLAREPSLPDDRARTIVPSDLATLVYTSGTTGPPKGTMITHGNVMSTVRSITGVIDITPEDRFISFLPLSHIAERVVSDFGQIVAGGETWFSRSLATIREDMPACRPTIFFAVPRVWEKLRDGIVDAVRQEHGPARAVAGEYLELAQRAANAAKSGERLQVRERALLAALDATVGRAIRRKLGLDKARILVSGAAPIHPDLLRFFAAIGMDIAEVYGQTEDCGPTSLNPPRRIRIGTVGPPIPGVEVRIAEDDGEILVRGGNVCAGYFKDPRATEALIDAEGWMHSGDLGSFDAEGYLVITGRKKDLIINSAGKNISPGEIETRLRFEPLISQAVVVGDGRPYLTALLTLDGEVLAKWTAERGLLGSMEDVAHDPDLLDAVQRSVERVNEQHSRIEGIKRWALLPHELTVDRGELTPTMKVKRQVVIERYADLVEQLYA
jgi:long-chain acyl-CoA synthetase